MTKEADDRGTKRRPEDKEMRWRDDSVHTVCHSHFVSFHRTLSISSPYTPHSSPSRISLQSQLLDLAYGVTMMNKKRNDVGQGRSGHGGCKVRKGPKVAKFLDR